MTIVFDDEELYTTLKVAAARSHRPAKDLVAEALQILFEATTAEQEALLTRARSRACVDGPPDAAARANGHGAHPQ